MYFIFWECLFYRKGNWKIWLFFGVCKVFYGYYFLVQLQIIQFVVLVVGQIGRDQNLELDLIFGGRFLEIDLVFELGRVFNLIDRGGCLKGVKIVKEQVLKLFKEFVRNLEKYIMDNVWVDCLSGRRLQKREEF